MRSVQQDTEMKIKKIYKFRPLSELLFKELRYSELYFSSYIELNDPLDLSARVNFKPINEKQLEYLIHFLVKTSLDLLVDNRLESEWNYNRELIKLAKNKELRSKICSQLYKRLIDTNSSFIHYDIIEQNIKELAKELQIEFRLTNFKTELQRIIKVFFESSFASCFSETCTDFLMWSHYASKHTGICIEFSLMRENQFPYFKIGRRNPDNDKFLEQYSEWKLKGGLYWDKIKKVKYQDSLPSISFYDFSSVFENEGDCDLMALSKSKWYGYANELERIYTIKSLPWKYEKEWRAIEINFGELKEPEQRIRHYPIEAVTGIYFGIRTPLAIKNRIYKILNPENEEINYYECQLSTKRDLEFIKWDFVEE